MIPLDLEYFINHCVPTVLTKVLALGVDPYPKLGVLFEVCYFNFAQFCKL